MSAPLLWIALPLLTAVLLWLINNNRLVAILSSVTALGLVAVAVRFPIDQAIGIGPLSFRIDPDFNILGRTISLTPGDQAILVIIYGMLGFWSVGALVLDAGRWLTPFGLALAALLVASLAVEPFLYAALLLEVGVLLSIPVLKPPGQQTGRGVMRFLAYETLAMPFILLSGFLLSGVEASPSDLTQVVQASTLLGLGFAFLLAVFPLHAWIPAIMEECPPYAAGLILLLYPTGGILFGMAFLDRFSWLRTSPDVYNALQTAGLFTLVTAGIWAAFQRHLGRLMGYSVIAETGITLIALGLGQGPAAIQIVFSLLIPRALALGVWSMALGVIARNQRSLRFGDVKGIARSLPFASAGVVLAGLSLMGMPLLASFPFRQVLWERVVLQDPAAGLWFGLAAFGLFTGAIRSLAVFVMADSEAAWQSSETWGQRILLGLGVAGIFILGLLPQWTGPLLVNLPALFSQIGR